MPHTSFTNEEKQQLLDLAYTAIKSRFDPRTALKPIEEPWMAPLRATFVTLKMNGVLRGCIGSINPVRSVLEDIWHNAQAAAFQDPRFPPLSENEIEKISIELSVLTEVQALSVATETELLQVIRPGVDGLIIEDGHRKATFLPSVWEQLPDAQQFLNQLRLKAGMPDGYWTETLQCSIYQAEKIQ